MTDPCASPCQQILLIIFLLLLFLYHTHRDAANNMMIRLLTLSLFWLRRASLSLGSLGMPGRPLAYLLRLTARLLQRPLNKVRHSAVWQMLVCTLHTCCTALSLHLQERNTAQYMPSHEQ